MVDWETVIPPEKMADLEDMVFYFHLLRYVVSAFIPMFGLFEGRINNLNV